MEMESEGERAQWEGEDRESAGQDTSREPPVLPVDGTDIGPSEGAAQGQPQAVRAGGASELWGLSEKIDAWQVSSIPQEKTYFALDSDLIDAAVTAIKARLDERDGNIRSVWLLTEVDHWDFEKERVVLLSDNNLISVKYNFIHSAVEELKYIPIAHITDLVYGDFKYTSSYFFSRTGKGLKVFWGKEENVGLITRWNPFTSAIPYTIFTSHVLVRKGRTDDPRLKIENVIPELERAVEDLRRAHASQQQEGEASASHAEFRVKQGDIIFNTYFGLSALVHNQSNLGFFKRRGAVDW